MSTVNLHPKVGALQYRNRNAQRSRLWCVFELAAFRKATRKNWVAKPALKAHMAVSWQFRETDALRWDRMQGPTQQGQHIVEPRGTGKTGS